MSRTVATLAVELGLLTAAFAEIRPHLANIVDWPEGLAGRLRDLLYGSHGSGGWYEYHTAGRTANIRPSPKLLALVAEIKAQAPMVETCNG